MATTMPGSPMSTVSTPTKAGFSSFMSSWRPGGGSPKTVSASPHSFSAATDDGNGTPKAMNGGSGSKLFPSYANGVRKREIIKEQQGQMDMLNMQVQHQGNELKRMGQQLEGERTARVDLHERLNMQYLKSNLLVDMLVLRLLETNSSISGKAGPVIHSAPQLTAAPAQAAGKVAPPPQQPMQQQQSAAAAAAPPQQQPQHQQPQYQQQQQQQQHHQQQGTPQQQKQQPQQQHAQHLNGGGANVAAKVAAAVAHDDNWDVSSVEDA